MVTTLYRIIKYGLKNFWRQRLVSLATLTVILLAILVFQGLLIFNSLSNTVIEKIRDKIDISVYFNTNVAEDDILAVKHSLDTLDEVRDTEYISRDEALLIFQETHKDDDSIIKALSAVDENPLNASINIKAKDPAKYPTIVAYLSSESISGMVSKITYQENQVVIDKLAYIIDVAEKFGIILTIVLSFVAVVVSFNTLLLAIYSNREEITIMRLVGASNTFIRGPFIIEGIIYGVTATIFSFIIILPMAYFVSPFLRILSPDIDIWQYLLVNGFALFGLSLLFGISIGVISSLIAVRKYLRI